MRALPSASRTASRRRRGNAHDATRCKRVNMSAIGSVIVTASIPPHHDDSVMPGSPGVGHFSQTDPTQPEEETPACHEVRQMFSVFQPGDQRALRASREPASRVTRATDSGRPNVWRTHGFDLHSPSVRRKSGRKFFLRREQFDGEPVISSASHVRRDESRAAAPSDGYSSDPHAAKDPHAAARRPRRGDSAARGDAAGSAQFVRPARIAARPRGRSLRRSAAAVARPHTTAHSEKRHYGEGGHRASRVPRQTMADRPSKGSAHHRLRTNRPDRSIALQGPAVHPPALARSVGGFPGPLGKLMASLLVAIPRHHQVGQLGRKLAGHGGATKGALSDPRRVRHSARCWIFAHPSSSVRRAAETPNRRRSVEKNSPTPRQAPRRSVGGRHIAPANSRGGRAAHAALRHSQWGHHSPRLSARFRFLSRSWTRLILTSHFLLRQMLDPERGGIPNRFTFAIDQRNSRATCPEVSPLIPAPTCGVAVYVNYLRRKVDDGYGGTI